jgi:hypothetical protein
LELLVQSGSLCYNTSEADLLWEEGKLLYIIINVPRATSVLASAWRGDTNFDREAGRRKVAAPNLRL